MQKLLDEVFADPNVNALMDRLQRTRAVAAAHHPHAS
jgi:hypothetical protein